MNCTRGVLLALLLLLLAPSLHAQTGWSVDRYEGFRANITSGTNVTTGWTTGNLGNAWDEGEWVPYRLTLQNVNLNNTSFSDIVICYDFSKGNPSARFVDLVRGIQVGSSPTGDGWPQSNGSAYPLTTVAQLQTAQNNQTEYTWTGYTLMNLPNSQVHRSTGAGYPVGGVTDAERCFIITRQDLLNRGFSGTYTNLYIYFNLHLSQTFIWTLSLQSQLNNPPTNNWGGYLYAAPPFSTDSRQGSGYVPGSSGHTYLTQGNRTVSIPIPPAPLGEISGIKWYDANNNGVRDNNEPVLEGWPIYISTIVGGFPVSYTELTDNAGAYSLTGLPQAIYTVSEKYQGPTSGPNYPTAAFTQTPPSTWDQSYPQINTTVGVATGIATSAPGLALGYGPESWSVDLSGTVSVQGNVNFGNFVPPPECAVTPASETACLGEQVTFTAARIAQGTPPYTVSWTGPNNFSASTFAITITAGPNTVGTYTAVLTDANGLQSQGCSATLSLYPQPACAITGGPTAVCAFSPGHTYFAPANNTPPVNIVGYSWQVTGNGTIVGPTNGQQLTVDATADGSYTVILTTESVDGCFSTCSTTVTVNPLPSCIITNTDPVCPGATTVHAGPANMSGYQWTISGNGTINGSTTSPTVSVTAGNANNVSYTLMLTVTDANNCSAMCQATVQVQDVTPPTMGCADDQTISCPAPTTLPFTPPTVTDNCDPNPVVIIVGDVTTPGSCPQNYSVTRTWRATDLWGNTAVCSQTIFVVDTQAPVINNTPPTPLTVECNAVPTAPTLTATDNCDPNPVVTYGETRTNGPCLDTYTLTRTWTATDACGNTSVFVQTINVQDTTPPVMSGLPQTPITVQCDAVPAPATPTATDNCDTQVDIVYGEVRTNGPCLDTYTLTRTWTATDNCGNTQQFVQTINVQDTTPPVMSGLPQTPLTVECSAVPAPATPTASDNCDNNVDIVYGEVRTNGPCLDTYTLTRTWTATDNCGNTQQFVQTINVQDTTPPILAGTPPSPITVECSAVPNPANVTATDNCDQSVDIVYGEVRTNGPCLDTYTLTRTWTATDNCGNTARFVQTINVQDTTPPVMSGLPQTPITVECSAVPNPPVVTATDNCDANVDIVYGEVRTNGPCLDTYTLTRTWTATDNCGNTQRFVQTINVQDTTPPVMSGLPQTPITVQCDAVPNPPTVTATDNCDTQVDIVYGEVRTNGPCLDTYTLTRTWTATDNCGNTQRFIQTINVVDTTPPVMSGLPPTPVTVQCSAVPNPPVVTATDNCDTQVDIVYGEVRTNGPCVDSYTLTRTWTATDNCGNTQRFVQTINVVDTTPPVMSGLPPTPITVQCDNVPNPPVVTATDNCDTQVDIVYGEVRTNGPCLDTYTLTRTWTATDNCGNTQRFVQTINVQDTTPPVMSGLPQTPITVQCDAVPAPATPTATDNCDTQVDIVYGEVRTNGPCLDTYTLTRTWTATDNCGNTQQFVQTINVQDTTPPVMSGLPQTPITVECSAVPAPATPTATDNCDTQVDIVYGEVRTNGPCLDTYTLTRTWTATDNCGNTQQFVQTINVQDTTPPIFAGTPQTPITVECSAVPSPANVTATDNCDQSVDITYTEVRTNGPCLDTYTLTRTWIATDNCGNTARFVQTINVQDTTPPVMSGLPQTPITVECSAVPNPPVVTATDNCDTNVDIVYGEVRTNGPCLDTYTLTRTWTATDNCGNTQQFVQTINVQDTTPPVMSGLPQTPITVQCDAVPNPPTVTATDNCDTQVDIVYGEVRTNGPCLDTYTLTRTWTATDNCGNTQRFVQTINVQDTTPPVMSGLPPTPITVQCDAVPNPPVVTATDNCDTQVDIVYGEVRTNGPCLDTYTLTRTWTATDNCGNTQRFVQTINVQDTTPPVMSGLPPTPITVQCDNVPNPPVVTATDNCDTQVDIVYGEVRTNGPCLDTYTLTRTWTATDNCGNTQRFVQTINVQDTTPPVMSGLPQTPITVQCDAVPAPATPTATDNCDTQVDIVYGEVRTNGPCLDTYTLTRTWTATDNCGNTQRFVQTINVQDTTPPVMSGLPQTPITVECSAVPNPPVITATDNCDANVDIVYGEVRTNGPCLDTYTLTRTWTATDNCGNTQRFVQTINVQDTTPPVMSGLPQTPITVQCDAVPNPPTVTATDNCDASVNIVYGEVRTNGPCLDTYTLTRTWTATDNCGNTQQFVQTINVQDTTPPVMSGLPQTPLTVQCDAVPTPPVVTATDNCDASVDIVYGEVRTNGPCLDTYTLTRTWTATDNCGNTQQFVQTINVQDTTPPVMSGLPQTPITVECDVVPTPANPTATDNCDTNVDIVYNESRTNGNCASNYTLTRTWTATDNCGNTQQFVQTINVQDTTPPALTSASDETVECDGQGNQAALTAWLANNGGATATDNCGSVSWSHDFTALSDLCGATGAATVTFTATDECGNTASTSATFTIEDTTPPTWDIIPADATIPCDQQVVFTTPTATDNCGTVTVNQVGQDVIVPGNCPQEYSVSRTWAAEDECGNTTGTVTQTITVADDVPPVLTAAPDKDVLCASIWDFDDPTVTDNCDTNPTVTIVSTTTVVLPSGEKEHTRTWVATDACGNTSLEVSQVVTEGRCQYFTLTQGAYGNANGSWCGIGHPRRLALIQQLLSSGPIVLGQPGRSLTITVNDAQCVINKLPGGGPAATLPVGDATFTNNCSTTIPYPLQGQRFRNGLLAQAITFALNLRLDPGLAAFNLPAPSTPYMRTEDPNYVNGICGDGDDLGLGTYVVNYIPPSVLTHLGSNGTNKTLADLLALANTALGGGSTGTVSLADISAALDAYNQGFDEGRFFAGYHAVPPPKSASAEVMPSDFQLFQNHPNPFNPSTTIEYSVPVNSEVHLTVYNALGNLVAVLVDGEVREGRHSVVWNSRAAGADLPSGIYTYRLIATGSDGRKFSAVKTMMLVK
ncbi:MAG: hypothetical protein M5R41_09110 [Bacteroidia bacterium]|nr:hypothetical protein [Bacteroidia bacterium]